MLEFNILKGQYLNRLDKDVVSADTTDLKAQFDLTSDFTGTITVWWRRSDVSNTYTSTLAADGTCTIPAEALAATDKAVYGPYDHDVFVSISDTGRTTTNEYKLTVLRSAFSTNATPGTGGSPTAYEELVEQFDELKADNQTFKENMTEQQETFENTVTENVDNIRYVVETETAPPIIEEASGAEITLDDSAYRQVRGLNLYGYSRQTQTTGAQLIKYPYLRQNGFTNNGVTYTVSDDGTITANGTATDQSLFLMASELSDWRPSGAVFLSGCPSGGSPTTYRIQLYNYNAEDAIAIDNGEGTAVNFTNADASWNLCIRIASGYTANNLTFKPMLNAGTSALPWEPYSGGVASPSPDWAQPIHSVADDTNLLDERLFTQTGTAFRFIHIQTDAESVTVSSNTPRTSAGSAYIQAIPGNVSSMEGISTSTNGVYAGQVRTISPADGYITIGYYQNGIGSENINFSDYWVMVNAGDTALPYRPYGHNVTVRSEGVNLIEFGPNQNSVTSNGITFKNLKDGKILVTGTCTADSYVSFLVATQSKLKLANGMYFLSGCPAGGSLSTFYLQMNNATVSGGLIFDTGNGSSVDFAQEGNSYGVSIVVRSGYTCNGLIFKPMLNRGSTPLPWQPYVAPSSALISLTDSLYGIPVTSGGNYTDEDGQQWIADYIYRRQTDGKWMLWRNCGSIVYDGSEDENWAKDPNFERFYSQNTGFQESTASNPKSLNSLLALTVSGGTQTYHNVYTITDSTSLYVSLNGTETLDDLKQLLAQKPMTLVGILVTPTIEELSGDVQTELNGLYTYNLHTDMWNNDGAYMGLKYVADTKTWINNKIAGLSTAMLNQN